ncbi:MAG: hypothetical protein MI744_14875 [Pseudomonadales bacterium]|nr:hypothetical protein [Pseudomonadales bacterium]
MNKPKSIIAALSFCCFAYASVSAQNFNETFDYSAGELEAVSGGTWIYNDQYYESLGNKLSADGSGFVKESLNNRILAVCGNIRS